MFLTFFKAIFWLVIFAVLIGLNVFLICDTIRKAKIKKNKDKED